MIQMKMRDEQYINLIRLDPIEIGQSVQAVVAGMDPNIQHDGHAAKFEDVAGSADFLARPQGGDGHDILHVGWFLCLFVYMLTGMDNSARWLSGEVVVAALCGRGWQCNTHDGIHFWTPRAHPSSARTQHHTREAKQKSSPHHSTYEVPRSVPTNLIIITPISSTMAETKTDEEQIPDMSLLDITDGENERKIPAAKFIEDIAAFTASFSPPASAELLIGAYSELHSKYKRYELTLTRKRKLIDSYFIIRRLHSPPPQKRI